MSTKEELNIQIKRFQTTAETFHKKGDRHWAYAKNGKGDYHYAVAKDAYAREKASLEKAAAYQRMLDTAESSGSRKINTDMKSFVGDTPASKTSVTQTAASGAVCAAALTAVAGVLDGNSAETIATDSASSAVAGGAASAVSSLTGTSATAILTETVKSTALAGTLAGQAVPVLGATLAGAAAGKLAFDVARPFVQDTIEGLKDGNLTAGIEMGTTDASLAVDDFLENTAGPARDGVCDVLDCICDALDSFSSFLDWL